MTAASPRPSELSLVAAVAAGGVIGAEARYGLAVLAPHAGGAWPWATLVTNVIGSLLIGALMTLLQRGPAAPHPLVRPFLGIGVLGGFTTFSTFAVDTGALLRAHRPAVALAYVLASVAGCLAATLAGIAATRRVGEGSRA